jgi:hypothetical protein
MSFLLSIFHVLSFVSSYVEWINTHVVIPLKDNLYDYTELPEAKLYIDEKEVVDNDMYYVRNGVERTFISTVSTTYVKTYTIYYRVTFPSYDVSHTQAITFEIKDLEPPVILSLPNFKITLQQDLPSFLDGVKISDNYDEASHLKISVNLTHIIKNRIGIYPIYYEVEDTSGNRTLGSSTIEIYDHLPPDITLKKAVILNYGSYFVYTDFFTIKDNYDLIVDVDLDVSHVDFHRLGTYPFSLTACDQSGNQNTFHFELSIIDQTPPVITLKQSPQKINVYEDVTHTLLKSFIIHVEDNYDDLTIDDVFIFHDIDPRTLGMYTVYYHLIDFSGNSFEVSLKVQVVDEIPPTLVIEQPLVFDVFSPTPHFYDLIDVFDNYDIKDDIIIKITTSPKMNVIGSYSIVIEITDVSKNKTTYRGYVEIVDRIPPVIEEIDQIIITDFQKRAYYSYFVATDQYSPSDEIDIIIDDSNVKYDRVGIFPIIIYAYDSSHNEAILESELIVLDIIPPTLSLTFQTYTQQVNTPLPDLRSFILDAYDNYDMLSSRDVSITHQIDTQTIGVYTITYMLKDASHNESCAYLEYRVDDYQKPKMTFTELILNYQDVFVPLEGVHIDEHSTKVTVTCYPYTIDTSIPGTYDIVYIATDERGNSTKLTRTITVLPLKEDTDLLSFLPMVSVVLLGAALSFYFWKKL